MIVRTNKTKWEMIPPIINHSNVADVRKLLSDEPSLQPGYKGDYSSAWFHESVLLEIPTGEVCNDFLKTMALLGRNPAKIGRIEEKDHWNAQGLEGKIIIKKPLINALLNLDLIEPYRGHIKTTVAALEEFDKLNQPFVQTGA